MAYTHFPWAVNEHTTLIKFKPAPQKKRGELGQTGSDNF